MKLMNIETILWIFVAILVLMGVSIGIYSILSPSFEGMIYLSGSATLAIAILTAVYVVTTRRQLVVMSQQLMEMKRDRELQNQPLPWPISVNIYSEKPRFLFSPPFEAHANVRHFLTLKLKNIGLGPAVFVDVCACLVIPKEPESIRFETVLNRIDVIGEKEIYPSGETEGIRFMFSDDENAELLTRLLDKDTANYPRIRLCVVYRNIMGACFDQSCAYLIHSKGEKQRDIIKDWLKKLSTFAIQYKEDIEDLSLMFKNEDPRQGELFEKLIQKCDEGLIEDSIEFGVWSIPGSARVKSISQTKYEEMIKNFRYGRIVRSDFCCV